MSALKGTFAQSLGARRDGGPSRCDAPFAQVRPAC